MQTMRSAAAIAHAVAGLPPTPESQQVSPGAEAGSRMISASEAIAGLRDCATQLPEMLRIQRRAALGEVANGTLTADAALARVEALRSIEAFSHHAWRSAAHLVDRG
jgi:phosphate:Na+ symporter